MTKVRAVSLRWGYSTPFGNERKNNERKNSGCSGVVALRERHFVRMEETCISATWPVLVEKNWVRGWR